MIEIGTIIKALSTVASAVDQIQQRKRTNQTTEQYEGVAKRLKDLEDTDLEQERLIGELSRNVEGLAKAVDAEIERNRARDIGTQRLVYVALILGVVALGIAVAALFR